MYRSKHILQYLIIISVNMGGLLWYVIIHIHGKIQNSFPASLVAIVIIILVLPHMPSLVPTDSPFLTVSSQIRQSDIHMPSIYFEQMQVINSFVHFYGADLFVPSICQFSVGNVCIFPSLLTSSL